MRGIDGQRAVPMQREDRKPPVDLTEQGRAPTVAVRRSGTAEIGAFGVVLPGRGSAQPDAIAKGIGQACAGRAERLINLPADAAAGAELLLGFHKTALVFASRKKLMSRFRRVRRKRVEEKLLQLRNQLEHGREVFEVEDGSREDSLGEGFLRQGRGMGSDPVLHGCWGGGRRAGDAQTPCSTSSWSRLGISVSFRRSC